MYTYPPPPQLQNPGGGGCNQCGCDPPPPTHVPPPQLQNPGGGGGITPPPIVLLGHRTRAPSVPGGLNPRGGDSKGFYPDVWAGVSETYPLWCMLKTIRWTHNGVVTGLTDAHMGGVSSQELYWGFTGSCL